MPKDNADDNTGTDLSGMKRLFNDTLSRWVMQERFSLMMSYFFVISR
jgi:hypothetical protein